MLIAGEVNGTIVLAGAISLAVTIAVGVAGYFFLRQERSARWLGARLQRPLSWILVKLKRDPITDGVDRAAELRTNTLAVLREGWALGSIGVAAFAIAFWAGAAFPITGSGLGVVDATLVAALIELSSADDDVLVAAALLWRVSTRSSRCHPARSR